MNLNHTHFPDWLANSWLFRKLFLLRKLFLVQKRFSHHGQMAEDVALKMFFPKKYVGFFVDVGCFHPVKYNNTYAFYKRGWRGVNIDIDEVKIEGFRMIRPKDTNVCNAVSDTEGEVTYWTNGFYSPTVSLSEDFTKGERVQKHRYVAKTTQARSLTAILDDTPYRDQTIDLLTVDVEGHDYQVLRSLDFERYSPTIIAVETQEADFAKVQAEETFRFLSEQGYELVNWVGMTLVFKREKV